MPHTPQIQRHCLPRLSQGVASSAWPVIAPGVVPALAGSVGAAPTAGTFFRCASLACRSLHPPSLQTGACRRADACPFSHGVFECWLHPTRYKTQLCTDGAACRRRVCFFAHAESELRRPEELPPLPPLALPAVLGAEVALAAQAQAAQQQCLAAALSGLLGGGAPPAGAPPPLPPVAVDPLAGQLHLLKQLSLGTGGAQGAGSLLEHTGSAPGTPLGSGLPAVAVQPDPLAAQAALLQQLGTPGTCLPPQLQSQRSSDVSVLSVHSTGSPSGEGDASPRGAAAEQAAGARAGTPPGDAVVAPIPADEVTQLMHLLQQQQQQQALGQQLGGALGADPALLAALHSLSLRAQQQQQQQQQQQTAAAAAAAAAASIGRCSLDEPLMTQQLSGGMQQAAAELQGQGQGLPGAAPAYLSTPAPSLQPPPQAALAEGQLVLGERSPDRLASGGGAAPGPAQAGPRQGTFTRSMSFEQ